MSAIRIFLEIVFLLLEAIFNTAFTSTHASIHPTSFCQQMIFYLNFFGHQFKAKLIFQEMQQMGNYPANPAAPSHNQYYYNT
jgi:hypothetical protein